MIASFPSRSGYQLMSSPWFLYFPLPHIQRVVTSHPLHFHIASPSCLFLPIPLIWNQAFKQQRSKRSSDRLALPLNIPLSQLLVFTNYNNLGYILSHFWRYYTNTHSYRFIFCGWVFSSCLLLTKSILYFVYYFTIYLRKISQAVF